MPNGIGICVYMRQMTHSIYSHRVSRCSSTIYCKGRSFPDQKSNSISVTNLFPLDMGSALGILLHYSVYPSDSVKLSYKDSLCLLRQFSSPCSSSSGLSWLVLTLSSSIKILESACQVPQRTCWDFYWNRIESVRQSEESGVFTHCVS